MKIVSRNVETQSGEKVHNFYFDENGTWVGITPSQETWEVQDGDDEETYMSGGYVVDGNTVIDYDGCFELPKQVILALSEYGYNIDL